MLHDWVGLQRASARLIRATTNSKRLRLTYRVAVGPERVRSAPPASQTPAASLLCSADADSSVRSACVHTPGPLVRHCHQHDPLRDRSDEPPAHLRQSTVDALGTAPASRQSAVAGASAGTVLAPHTKPQALSAVLQRRRERSRFSNDALSLVPISLSSPIHSFTHPRYRLGSRPFAALPSLRWAA